MSTVIAELAERSPIIIQNSSNPSSRKKFGCTTVRPTVQGANFSIRGLLYQRALFYNQSSTRTRRSCEWKSINITTHFIHSRGFSFVEERCGKKKCELRFWACLNLYITSETNDDCDGFSLISMARIEKYRYSPQLKLPRYTKYNKWLEFQRVWIIVSKITMKMTQNKISRTH